MKLFNIALSFLMLLGVVACDPMNDYTDTLDKDLHSENAYKIHIASRNELSESDYTESSYLITEEDYDRCDGTASYHNFSSYTPVEENMPLVMDGHYAGAGEVIPVMYSFYDGTTTTHDNIAFVTFIKEELTWVVVPNFLMIDTDNTSKNHSYTLVEADYKMLGFTYSNFDLRYNSRADIVADLNTVLKTNNLLDLKDGDIWEMNFATYSTHEDGSVTESPLYLEVTIVD